MITLSSPLGKTEQQKHNADVAEVLDNLAKQLRSGDLHCADLKTETPVMELPWDTGDGFRKYRNSGEINISATFYTITKVKPT